MRRFGVEHEIEEWFYDEKPARAGLGLVSQRVLAHVRIFRWSRVGGVPTDSIYTIFGLLGKLRFLRNDACAYKRAR